MKSKSDDSELGRPDPYEELIPQYRFVPIMNYENINSEELAQKLSSDYDGFIITSQRAVDSLKIVLANMDPGDRAKVLQLPVYTVGPATAERLKILQFTKVLGENSGNGVALGHEILADPGLKPHSRFLFAAGEVHRRQLPDMLLERGHNVDTVIVYRTQGNLNIRSALENEVANDDWIVFFSPSYTQPVLEFLRDSQTKVNLAAIGPTTEEYLQREGFIVSATAAKPSAQSLKDALHKSI